MRLAIEAVRARVGTGEGGYVCFSNVHSVVMAKRDPRLRDITNTSFLSMPDGKPLAILGRVKGVTGIERVAGPDFLPRFIHEYPGLRHFFYGSTQQTLDRLLANLQRDHAGIIIAGSHSPPYRELTDAEVNETINLINGAKPDVVWVGLGAPKQEYWMAAHWQKLRPAVVLGVGAAFDFHAGSLVRAPGWMQRYGLEWFYRLTREPSRLWKRYLIGNSLFLWYLLRQAVAGR
jgi:exopolysaccharide biosynthesis WecB/TagA/CpsF family protein